MTIFWRCLMKKTDIIMKMAKENHGIITNMMIDQIGISRGNLKYLADSGKIERTARGVYTLPEVWEDEFVNLQTRFKRGIFSHESSLFLHDLSDRTPNNYHMTFPATYNLTAAKHENIRCTQVIDSLYLVGIEDITSPGGNLVRTYCMERTLCDVLKPRNSVDIQIVTDAFKQYTMRKDKNIPLLSYYGKLFKVEKKLRSYLEVLL